MIDLKKIDIKYLISAVFGVVALIFSIFAGLFSGNGLSTILFRTITNTILFSLIGFFCLLVFKKFVPEVYQIICSLNNMEVDVNINSSLKENEADHNIEGKAPSETSISDISSEANRDDTVLENEFNTFEKDNFRDSSSDTNNNIAGNKSFKELKKKYEPKIAAQAIRTMLKRDE